MRKLSRLISMLLCAALCAGVIPAFAESDAFLEMNGVYLEYAFTVPERGREESASYLDRSKSAILERLFGFGYQSVRIITIDGGTGIRIEVSGVTDPNEVASKIGGAAKLSFRYEDDTEFLTSKNVASVGAAYDEWSGYYVVLELDDEGAEIFAEATEKAVGHCIGIYLDDTLLMNPRIEQPIYGGIIAIRGGFTVEEAANMAAQIQAGALPFELTLVRMGTMQIVR